MKKNINKIEKAILAIVSMDHIEDRDYTIQKVQEIKALYPQLSEEAAGLVEDCMDLYLAPLFDPHYFDFIHSEYCGRWTEENTFEIKDEHAMEVIAHLFAAHVAYLEFQVEHYFAKYFKEYK